MNWVDLLLIGLVAVAAIEGLRLGATVQVCSFGGFWLGIFVGALVVPHVMSPVHGAVTRGILATLVVFGIAGLLSGLGRHLGVRSSTALRRARLGPLDGALGVMVAVVATLFIAWFAALVVESTDLTSLDAAIQDSRIVRAMDDVLPAPPTILARVKSFLASEGFPVVFAGLSPQPSAPVALPGSGPVRSAVLSAQGSTLQVEAEGCGAIEEGSSFVVAPQLVVTNAHVVAGTHNVVVVDGGRDRGAVPIWFDPELDIAVLRVLGLGRSPLPVDTRTLGRGAGGVVLGYPAGGPLAYGSAGITAAFEATGLDIYGRNTTTREVYELRAAVRPGNSGGPLVAAGDGASPANGTVIGVVFARSTADPQVGYALAMGEVMADVGRAQRQDTPVSTGDCAE
jgi:S1-C subfamily serine protease